MNTGLSAVTAFPGSENATDIVVESGHSVWLGGGLADSSRNRARIERLYRWPSRVGALFRPMLVGESSKERLVSWRLLDDYCLYV